MISVVGVTIGVASLIVVLSVFNGFDGVIQSMYNAFDPDIKITPATGKVFTLKDRVKDQIINHPSVLNVAETFEENALLKYDDQQTIATIKGVSENFREVSGVDTMIVAGEYVLHRKDQPFAIVGQGVAYYLSLGLNYINPIVIYVPKRDADISTNPARAFNRNYIFPSGVFGIQQEFDTRYVIVPLDFARDLFDYENQLSALEIKLKPERNIAEVQNDLRKILGSDFLIKNRYEQHEAFYKIMKSEKVFIFIILTFILIIASFNVIGSLTMLIIDKKEDIATFRSLGANLQTIRKIFLAEGWLITLVGAVFGLLLGGFICWLQIEFELVTLQGSASFIIDAYPVKINWTDFVAVFVTIALIGFLAAWYPVRYITRRYVLQELERV
ncbi:MAG: FtsX-like permease family protein [Bacteroidales bacterium]|jgi:lipoprotein-releasing system permease protein|nr:FtsX-like permease family protein [Bacteroidales bacterium]